MHWTEAPVIRPLRPDEYAQLEEYLYLAIFVPSTQEPPPRAIIRRPELRLYIESFGTKRGDHALAAEQDGSIVGIAWVRHMHDYGFVSEDIPSLAISVREDRRGQGIGTNLLRHMQHLLKDVGCEAMSLSVQKENPAMRLYLRSGFQLVRETDEEYVMVCPLAHT